LPEPISIAKQKATERGLTVMFLVMDALTLKDLQEDFDAVIGWVMLVPWLRCSSRADGCTCFSDDEPGTQGPRRVSENEIRDTFAQGWVIESIERSRYEVRPDPNDLSFKDGGPKAWFVVVKREYE